MSVWVEDGMCTFTSLAIITGYVTSVMCPAGTQCSLRSCVADHVQGSQERRRWHTAILSQLSEAQAMFPAILTNKFRLANQPAPKILYVDRGCCRAQGPTTVETLFQSWGGQWHAVRLDIFHWIHQFDAAMRTESHSKYTVFKSALAGAVLAYNCTDLELLIKAVRAKDTTTLKSVSDKDVVRHYISREQLKHHVRRVTIGAHETFRLIHLAIEELKGPAGLDESGVSLFKTPGVFTEAIDGMWAGQQRHLECIQDSPDMNMYKVARTTTINHVDVPYCKCLHGSNNLEGFHKTLPHMIPSTQM
ncbi:uncharacterized protein LOC122861614 [Siniperca chuatsi]|uniref:uncharacterized protein LOC122861614 n=1 Tax=Siniperca chuatsi TaxID=119488 RepID=UPI001CE1A0E3|nr:uncharacterized protein LOC122861614 [Siniperca chuatsi]